MWLHILSVSRRRIGEGSVMFGSSNLGDSAARKCFIGSEPNEHSIECWLIAAFTNMLRANTTNFVWCDEDHTKHFGNIPERAVMKIQPGV
jgi:hypothetical protein